MGRMSGSFRYGPKGDEVLTPSGHSVRQEFIDTRVDRNAPRHHRVLDGGFA